MSENVELKQVENENGKFTYVRLPERPADVPEKFWHPENGLNLTALNSGYQKLESGRAQWQEETRRNLESEIKGQLPKPPDTYSTDGITVDDAPEGFAFDPAQDPVVALLAEAGKEAGLTQDGFATLAKRRAAAAAAQFKQTGAQVREVLGENYQERINRVQGRLKDALGDELGSVVAASVNDPRAVAALEKLVGGNGAPGPGDGGTSPELTEAKLKGMMNDPRYYDPRYRDPAYVAEVEAGFKKLYEGQQHDGEPRWTSR